MTLLLQYVIIFSLAFCTYVIIHNHTHNGSVFNFSGLIASFKLPYLYPLIVATLIMVSHFNTPVEPINHMASATMLLGWNLGYYQGLHAKKQES